MNTKKVIGAFFAAAAFIMPAVSFAAVINNDPQDFATLRVANNTENPAGTTTAWAGTANAKAGDTVSFAIYYHNTGPDTATNVRVRLTPRTTNAGTVQAFTAIVSADNAAPVNGTATVYLSSSQTISFDGTTYWYPYNSNPTTQAPLLNGQSGAELFNGVGLNLGNIAPGWSTQGSVTANFHVSATPVANLSAPSVTTNAATNVAQTSVTLNGVVTPNGSETTSWFEWGTTSSFGTTIQKGSQGAGTSAVSITAGIWNLTQNTTYYFRAVANNAQGTTYGATLSFTTSGNVSQSTLPTITTNSATSISQNSAAINGYVNPNGTTDTVRWFEWGTSASGLNNQTTHYNHGTNPDGFSTNLSGLAQNTTYYFRAVAQNSQGVVQGATLSFVTTNGNGGGNQSQATVTTQSATNIGSDTAILNGYVDPNGTSDTTRWFEWGANSSSNMYYQTTRYNQGSTAGSFSAGVSNLSQNTTYYFRAVAQNAQGTVYGNTVTFTVGNNCNSGSYWNCGNNSSAVSTRNADTAGTYAVLNGYSDPNGNGDTVHWFEWGTNNSLGQSTQYVGQGNFATSFSATVTGLYPGTTYYYRAVARNTAGTVYGSTLSFTTSQQVVNNTGSAPAATTLLATNISASSAVLNSLVFSSNGQSTNAWFEWGTNGSMTSRTQTYVVGTLPVARYADTINGLVNGQTYYYRVVAENNYGRVYGSVLSFVATNPVIADNSPVVITTPAPVRTTTQSVVVVNRGTGTESLITLTIDGGDESIAVGEKRVYHVVWKNDSAQTLKNVVLRVNFSQSMIVESATRGSYSANDNAVAVDVKTLAPGEQGDTFIFATAGSDLKIGQLLVVTANMVYTTLRGAQGDAIAYVTQRVVDSTFNNGLSASIFGAGPFLPTTVFGWMLLIILVLALVLIGHYVYGRFATEK